MDAVYSYILDYIDLHKVTQGVWSQNTPAHSWYSKHKFSPRELAVQSASSARTHCPAFPGPLLEKSFHLPLSASFLILHTMSQNIFLDTRTAQTCHSLPFYTCTSFKPCMAITLPPTCCHPLGSWPVGWADLGCAGRISLALCHPHVSCRVPPYRLPSLQPPFPEFYIPFSF